MLGGVAAGVADYFDVDPTIVRLIFVLSIFVGGAGILAYIVMWIIVPQGPFVPYNMDTNIPPQNQQSAQETESKSNPTGNENANTNSAPKSETGNDPVADYFDAQKKHSEKRGVTFGIILVIVGIFLLADNMIPRIHFHDIFPLALVVLGIVLLLNAINK